jgi:ATP-dependent exoDNAse (exonuclease V) beta subunit
VLDYKTGTPADDAGLQDDYRRQLAEYRDAVRALFPSKAVRAMLLFADGRAAVLDES